MSTNKQKILVTGATGFLGTNILQAFQGVENIEVIAACRDKTKLAEFFIGEIREGDLRDSSYLKTMLKDIDVVCHAGTWAAMWSHKQLEKQNFYLPTKQLIETAINAGVKRFLLANTAVIANKAEARQPIDDFSSKAKTGFWPHLDYLVDIDNFMQTNANRGMQMVSMRLGHFIGKGNKLGLVPVLVPRLKTYLVPWLSKGHSRLPLITDTDSGKSFVKASLANSLNNYESFNICGSSFPTTKEVIEHIHQQTGLPKPLFSVPYALGYPFAWLMEKLYPLLPGKAPFLTRSIVHLAEDWHCDTRYANEKLGYLATKDWQDAMNEALQE